MVKRINNCMTDTVGIFYKGHFGNQKQTRMKNCNNQYVFIMSYSIF